MTLQPVTAHVLIRPDALPEKVGRIFIPHTARHEEILATGVVVALGPGMPCKDGSRWPMPDVMPGDRVAYRPSGNKIKLDDIDHEVVYDTALWAVIEDMEA